MEILRGQIWEHRSQEIRESHSCSKIFANLALVLTANLSLCKMGDQIGDPQMKLVFRGQHCL